LKPRLTAQGYHTTKISNKNGRKDFSVHQLVMMTFHNIFPSKDLEIDHINRIRNDNRSRKYN
jgi:hypothetical protein